MINEKWISYLMAVVSVNPKIQKDEVKRAFYAGAISCMNLMLTASDDSDAASKIAEVQSELVEFADHTIETFRRASEV